MLRGLAPRAIHAGHCRSAARTYSQARRPRWPRQVSLALAIAFAGLVACLQRTDFFLGFGRSRVAATDSRSPRSPPRVQSKFSGGDVEVEERLHELSEWEADAVAELRRRLAVAGLGQVPEGLLQRCARASGDVEQAYAQLRDIMRWRQHGGVAEILDRPEAIADEHWYRHILQYGLPGKDRQGRAVMIEAVGQWDMTALDRASRERREAMLRSHVVVCETLLRQAQESAGTEAVAEGGAVPRIRGFVAVLDMKGISLAQNPMGFPELLNTLKEISKINARYYPEAIEHVFVVNAPSVFRVIWKALAPFVLPTSGVQVDVLRTGQFGPLVRELGKDVLPEQLGGSLPANTAPYSQE
mmetsp:Transcript_10039/g.29655  ORF Transcript_10039/g.29655 Transcript_10039/m.29655 type:complete len:356 (+) Transcript_10039:62-1129(+)